jgi:hypothetical protein
MSVDGGGGVDTLKLDGAGLTLDLTKISNSPSFIKFTALVLVLPKMI